MVALLVAATFAAPGASAALHLSQVATFSVPVYVTAPPGDPHRLFVVEKAGRIMEVRDGQKLDTPFLDLSGGNQVVSGGERGMLSMAFAPDYATSRNFYVYYTAPRAGDANGSVITIQEFKTLAGNPDAVDPASRRTVTTIDHPTNSNHDGGQLQFGPDGALYAGTGDGGSISMNVSVNAQNVSSPLGKLLRIDPATGNVQQWSRGLRNPFRFSCDRQTGDLAIADVGESAVEEIDFVPGGTGFGNNYGWNCLEGNQFTGRCSAEPQPNVRPVLEKTHSGDGFHAIIGGYVVRDPSLGPLVGRYVYGDNSNTAIRSAVLAVPRATGDAPTGLTVNGLTSFGEDSCGHVYAASGAGPVYRIDGDAFTPCPERSVPDTRAPALTIGGKARQRVLRLHGLRVALTCDETCGATVRARARVGRSKRRYALRTVTRQLAAGRRTTVTVRMPRRTRRAVARGLRHHRRVKIVATATARDAAANSSRRARSFRARR